MARTRSAKATRGKSSLQNERSDPDLDLISNLPVDAYNAILMCLPLRDAVRTSILSRKWRYRWASIPHLVFDGIKRCAIDLADIVNGVLLVHNGPVHKFVCSYYVKAPYHLDQWILFLSKNGIKQLTLGFLQHSYRVHSRLFSCQAPSDLHLTGCKINPPPAFEGFRGLRNLYLQRVCIANDELERLILKCPLLETLTLKNCYSRLIHFVINALNLRHLCLSGEFKDLQITNSPLLITAAIDLTRNIYGAEHLEQGGVCNLIKILGSLHHIEKLELQGYLLEFFSMGNVPDVLPTSFLHLKNLSMGICFNDRKVVLTALCMLRSSPNLEMLEFSVCGYGILEFQVIPNAGFWEAQEHLGCLLNHLRTVKMTGIMGDECELCFIRFLLANAPVLETMSTGKIVKKSRFLKDMLQLRRASTQAIIICD
ncbi:F-box/FBD/LRR-repeat protein At1g13570-like isoform X2 [Magnolia sinica]|uniref:F-box/FBD/LRR-repeat protein At1g13570-like isoform X2 n=1 Tax=Magnolia sinica TaxID=86752 RepID=UPI0026580110|nr:F-box/FBD/LRR-repeat protein At1g13570-like isoform X2 [Magnolia sinica]